MLTRVTIIIPYFTCLTISKYNLIKHIKHYHILFSILVNPYASSGNSSDAGNDAKSESMYTNPPVSLTQTTSSNQKNISSIVPNLTSRVVFNESVNTINNGNRQVICILILEKVISDNNNPCLIDSN